MSTLGKRLRTAMDVRGVGFRDLDRAIGKPETAGWTSRVCSGENKSPNVELLIKAADFLRTDIRWIVSGEGPEPTVSDPVTMPGRSMGGHAIGRLDPLWEAESAIASARRNEAMPQRYIDEVGEMAIAGGRRPTWALILRLAEVLWFADLADTTRQGSAPPSGVMPAINEGEPDEAPTVLAAHRRR